MIVAIERRSCIGTARLIQIGITPTVRRVIRGTKSWQELSCRSELRLEAFRVSADTFDSQLTQFADDPAVTEASDLGDFQNQLADLTGLGCPPLGLGFFLPRFSSRHQR